eukprot:m.26305 g.26305  ORF g.26305 m.26305 type:complete len:442 (-) comp8925_c0_seq2:28-1353(-)
MRDIISLHVGQAGCAMGAAYWELLCLEHGITPDGQMPTDKTIGGGDDLFNKFFYETSEGKHVPRAVFVDLEPTIIDGIRKGTHGALYNPDELIAGNHDAGNCYARGHYSVGKESLDMVEERVRLMMEQSQSVQGFMFFHSLGGGTGSGFASLLIHQLCVDFGKKPKMQIAVLPDSQMSVVEPYNAVLAVHDTIEHIDLTLLFDNEACYEICNKRLDIERPTYDNLNRLIAQVLAAVTTPLRFQSELNTTLNDFAENLAIYNRLHFPLLSFSPFASCAAGSTTTPTAETMVTDCLYPEAQLVKCNPLQGRFTNMCVHLRGDIVPTEMNAAIARAKARNTMQFVSWSRANIKVGINYQRPVTMASSALVAATRTICMLRSTTAITEAFARLTSKFDLLAARRAFMHHFVAEGMQEEEFALAREDLAALQSEYQKLGRDEAPKM